MQYLYHITKFETHKITTSGLKHIKISFPLIYWPISQIDPWDKTPKKVSPLIHITSAYSISEVSPTFDDPHYFFLKKKKFDNTLTLLLMRSE